MPGVEHTTPFTALGFSYCEVSASASCAMPYLRICDSFLRNGIEFAIFSSNVLPLFCHFRMDIDPYIKILE